MFVKYDSDDGKIFLTEFESSIIKREDGVIKYYINKICVFETHMDESGNPLNNKGELIFNKIYKAIELRLPIVDLTMDLKEEQYD